MEEKLPTVKSLHCWKSQNAGLSSPVGVRFTTFTKSFHPAFLWTTQSRFLLNFLYSPSPQAQRFNRNSPWSGVTLQVSRVHVHGKGCYFYGQTSLVGSPGGPGPLAAPGTKRKQKQVLIFTTLFQLRWLLFLVLRIHKLLKLLIRRCAVSRAVAFSWLDVCKRL